jgi:hypothetical protein
MSEAGNTVVHNETAHMSWRSGGFVELTAFKWRVKGESDKRKHRTPVSVWTPLRRHAWGSPA